MASDRVCGEMSLGGDLFLSLKRPLHPRKPLNYGIPDAKLGPGHRGQLHHQVDIHKDAQHWEDGQSRDLGAKSVTP